MCTCTDCVLLVRYASCVYVYMYNIVYFLYAMLHVYTYVYMYSTVYFLYAMLHVYTYVYMYSTVYVLYAMLHVYTYVYMYRLCTSCTLSFMCICSISIMSIWGLSDLLQVLRARRQWDTALYRHDTNGLYLFSDWFT